MSKFKTMEITEKAMERIMSIIEIDGFHVTSHGDPSVGIFDAEWKVSEKFYFDNQDELNAFKEGLKRVFENYCGEVSIETFNERQTQIEAEERQRYESYPVRYLIRDYGDCYMQAGRTGVYGSAVGDAIHVELPHYIKEGVDDVIKSSDPEFQEILLKAAGRLEKQIINEEYSLRNAKRNLALIKQELNYGK